MNAQRIFIAPLITSTCLAPAPGLAQQPDEFKRGFCEPYSTIRWQTIVELSSGDR
ncbi:MAG: hypothetical protein ACI8XO_003896 [Verrucomicrobiales bacterium]|jgi:hypothetical protein